MLNLDIDKSSCDSIRIWELLKEIRVICRLEISSVVASNFIDSALFG